jgi:hypothetical protein
MKKYIVLGLAGVVAIIILAAVVLHTRSKNLPPATGSSSQVLPVKSNPILNTSQQSGLVVLSAMAEDNVDPVTNQAISDRLQIKLQNVSSSKMSAIEVYYVMKDAKTGQQEAYYQKLTGLTLAPNETKTIYFDNEQGAGHYPENRYSLYRSSKNEVDFTIEVSAPGFKPANTTTKKSAGTGETAG